MSPFRTISTGALAIVAALALVCTTAHAQGYVGVFADPEGTDCHPEDLFPHVVEVFVLHMDADAASASQFKIETGGGFDGTFLGEFLGEGIGIQVGNSITGTAIGYGNCLSSPITLLKLTYYCRGQSQSCSFFRVTDYTVEGKHYPLAMIACGEDLLDMPETVTYVNSNDSCPCTLPGFALATVPTTWGQVKAIYGE